MTEKVERKITMNSKQQPAYTAIVAALALATKPFVRLKITGLENVPEVGGAILVLNHVSLLDPVLIGVALRRKRQIRALAKESLFRAPFIGSAMTSMGHIPVHRGGNKASDSLKDAVIALQQGELIGIYPEGTVPQKLGELQDFKTGAARLTLETGVPLIPVAQWGAQNVLGKGKGKLRTLLKALFTRPVHTIVIGEPIAFSYEEDNVAELTETIRRTIIRDLQPLTRN